MIIFLYRYVVLLGYEAITPSSSFDYPKSNKSQLHLFLRPSLLWPSLLLCPSQILAGEDSKSN